MSGIALYNTLRKIPEVSEAEAKEVATKADLANLETRLIEKMAKLGLSTILCNFIFNIKSAFIFYCKSVHRRYPISQRHRPVFGCFFNG